MRSLLLVFFFALGALTPILVAQDPPKTEKGDKKAVKKYVSEEGNYKIAFPSKPRLQEKKIQTTAGETVLRMAIAEKANSAYLVNWNVMPSGTKDFDPKKILDEAEQGVLKSSKLLTTKPVEFGPKKTPAREVICVNQAGIHYLVLIIVTDDRLYQVLVGGSKELVASEEAKDFLKSMELTGDEK